MDHVGTIKLEFDRLANGQTNLICQDDLATIWLQVAHTPPPLLASYCDPQTSFGRASQERGHNPEPVNQQTPEDKGRHDRASADDEHSDSTRIVRSHRSAYCPKAECLDCHPDSEGPNCHPPKQPSDLLRLTASGIERRLLTGATCEPQHEYGDEAVPLSSFHLFPCRIKS